MKTSLEPGVGKALLQISETDIANICAKANSVMGFRSKLIIT